MLRGAMLWAGGEATTALECAGLAGMDVAQLVAKLDEVTVVPDPRRPRR
jgi:hypothetical protein